MPFRSQLEDAIQQEVQIVINLAPHTVHDTLPDEEHCVKSL